VAVTRSLISGRASPVPSAEISAFVVVPLRLAIAPAMVDGRGVQSLQPAIEILASHGLL